MNRGIFLWDQYNQILHPTTIVPPVAGRDIRWTARIRLLAYLTNIIFFVNDISDVVIL